MQRAVLLPMAVMAVMILRGRKRLHIANVILAGILVGLVGLALVSGTSPVGIYDANPLAFLMSHLIILGLATLQFVIHVLGIPASCK